MRNIDDLKRKVESNKLTYNSVRKYLLFAALFPIFILFLICDIFYYEIKDIQSQYQTEVDYIKERRVEAIYSIIQSRREQGLMQNQYVVNTIKRNIKNNYSDNNILRYDLITRSSPFIDLCSEAINKDMNIVKEYTDISSRAESIFICDKIGIITDNGYVEKSIVNRSWSDEINHKYNHLLADNAIYMLIGQNKDIIFWESDKNISGYVKPSFNVTEPNNYILKEIIRNSDIYALKNFNILIPSYITDTGDIFGVPDVDEHGLPNDNNKIIVVREINMFDIVAPYIDGLRQYDLFINNYTLKIEDYIKSKIILYLTFSIICLFAIVIVVFIVRHKDNKKYKPLLINNNRGGKNDNDNTVK